MIDAIQSEVVPAVAPTETAEVTPEVTPEVTTLAEAAEASAENVEPTPEVEETEEKNKDEKKSGFKKRIDKLSKKAEVAKQEADYWRAEALKQKAPQAPQAPAQYELPKPQLSQFSNIDEYQEALVDYKLAQRDAQAQGQKIQEYQHKVIDSYKTKVAEFIKITPDYQEALDDVNDVPVAAVITQALAESDVGPQLAYYLAKNPDEINRLNNLSVNRCLIELGKLEDRVGTKPTEGTKPKVTKPAPAPIKPVTGNTSIATKDISQMTPEELIASRNAAERKRMGR